jgi:hypothetical protein
MSYSMQIMSHAGDMRLFREQSRHMVLEWPIIADYARAPSPMSCHVISCRDDDVWEFYDGNMHACRSTLLDLAQGMGPFGKSCV